MELIEILSKLSNGDCQSLNLGLKEYCFSSRRVQSLSPLVLVDIADKINALSEDEMNKIAEEIRDSGVSVYRII